MSVDLDRLDELHKNATPPPWYAQIQTSVDKEPNDIDHSLGIWTDPHGGPNNLVVFSFETAGRDFALMAELRTAYPAMSAELRQLRKEVALLREVVRRMEENPDFPCKHISLAALKALEAAREG